jgi:hypothetical protein
MIHGRIVQDDFEIGLPTSGILKDGRTVSNYNLLPESVLQTEGWMLCKENKPVFDPQRQYLKQSTVTFKDNAYTVNYVAVDLSVIGG